MRLSFAVSGSPPLARGPHGQLGEVERAGRLTPARAGTTPESVRRRLFLPAHPRSRGDHDGRQVSVAVAYGSPPLARGPLPMPVQPLCLQRLTPARAGTTEAPSTCVACRPAHPRSRGDHVLRGLLRHVRRGSPPLARGPRRRGHRIQRLQRLTPARAGTTGWKPRRSCGTAAHPRSRGDHRTGPSSADPTQRLTPARAGTTLADQPAANAAAAHPRSRGDHFHTW